MSGFARWKGRVGMLRWCFLMGFYLQGHDCCPMLFNCDDRGLLSFVSKLDIPKQSIQRNISAMERFRNMDKRATTEDRNTTLETLHQNSITWVSCCQQQGRQCSPCSLRFPGCSANPQKGGAGVPFFPCGFFLAALCFWDLCAGEVNYWHCLLMVNVLCTLDTAYLIKYVGSSQAVGSTVQNPLSKIHLKFTSQLPILDVTAMCIYLLCTAVFRLEEGRFSLNIQKNPSLWGWGGPDTGCPERLWLLHPGSFQGQVGATWGSRKCPCPQQGVGLDWALRSLSA